MDEEKDSNSNQLEESEIENISEKDEILKENIAYEIEEPMKEAKSKKSKITIIIGVIIGILILLFIIVNITVSKYDNLVYPGVSIYEEDLSKLNEVQLKEKLLYIENSINSNKIYIETNSKEYNLKIKDIVSGYNTNRLNKDILNYGKNENKIQKFFKIILKSNKDFKFNININNEMIKNYIQNIADETNRKCVEPKVQIDNEEINYIDGKKGINLNKEIVLNKIIKNIKENNIYKEKIKIKAKYEYENPTIKMDDLKNVNSKISTYSTNYAAGGGRGKNVELAAKKLDSIILIPGEEFSYEEALGDITQENGYTYAPIIIDGELKDGIGGGVCQVSSTLYNTQLKAGIVPTERRNHSKAVNYVPRGLDATLATGSIDYKFKNTYKYPIVLNTKAGGGTLTIEFWSNEKTLNGIEYKAVGYASGNVANTYLYGYNKDGKKIYEKHIDTSVYR